jgi:ribosomal-protein-alanine N-acetyltransferase
MSEFEFLNPSEEDLGAIYRLELECFSEDAYNPQILLFYLKLFREGFIIARDRSGRIAGYVIGIVEGGGVGHVISICVSGGYRRRGLGRMLMKTIEEYFRRKGACISRLEVRISNEAALNLYRSLGYEERDILRSYYSNGEDAYLMYKKLC